MKYRLILQTETVQCSIYTFHLIFANREGDVFLVYPFTIKKSLPIHLKLPLLLLHLSISSVTTLQSCTETFLRHQ